MWLSRMPGDEFWYFLWRNYNEKYLLMTLMIIIMIMKQNIQLMILLDPSLCWTIFIFSNSIIHTWFFAQIKFFNVIFTLRTNEEKFLWRSSWLNTKAGPMSTLTYVFMDTLIGKVTTLYSLSLWNTSNIYKNKIACFKVKLNWTRGSFFVFPP